MMIWVITEVFRSLDWSLRLILLCGDLFFETTLSRRKFWCALLMLGEDPIDLLFLMFDFLVHVEFAFDFALDVCEGGICRCCKRGCMWVHWPFTSRVGLVLFRNNWSVCLLHDLHVNRFVYWSACTCCFLMGSISISTVAFHTLIDVLLFLNPIFLRSDTPILGHSIHDTTLPLSLVMVHNLNIASSTHVLLQLLQNAWVFTALILV